MEQDPQRIQAAREAQDPRHQSVDYYTRAGYPQYAGRYAAPNLPPGAVVKSIQEETSRRPNYAMRGRETGETTTERRLILTVEQQQQRAAPPREVPDNSEALLGFGMSTEVWNPSTGKRYVQQGSDVSSAIADVEAGKVGDSKYYAELVPGGPGVQQDTFEQKLSSGVLNFQVVSAPFAVPKLIPFALGGVAVGEGIKYATTGKHLTIEEGFAAAGIGELAGVGIMIAGSHINSKYVNPRVTKSLTNDYVNRQQLNEQILSGKVAGETQLWKPTMAQRIQMKITGAQPKTLATGLSSFSSAQDAAYSLSMMEAESASFDMGFSPRSSFVGYNKGPTPPRAPILPSKLPLYFGLGTDTFEQVAEGPSQYIWEKPEKGLPESRLSYDYRGPLSYRRPSAFDQIRAMKQTGGGKMKPLWEDVESNPVASAKLQNPTNVASNKGGSTGIAVMESQRTSGISFTSPITQTYATEEQILSYPQSGLPHPPIMATNIFNRQEITQRQSIFAAQRQGLFTRTIPGLISLQRTSQTPSTSQISKQTLKQIPQQENIHDLRLDIPEPVIPEPLPPRQKTKQPQTFDVPSPGKSISGFSPPGFTFEGGGYDLFSPKRRSGLRSRKKVYPILTAKEVLQL